MMLRCPGLAEPRPPSGGTCLVRCARLVTGSERVLAQRLVGYRQVTDAHLLALARRRGARLATLDHAVRTLAGENSDDVVVVPMPRRSCSAHPRARSAGRGPTTAGPGQPGSGKMSRAVIVMVSELSGTTTSDRAHTM